MPESSIIEWRFHASKDSDGSLIVSSLPIDQEVIRLYSSQYGRTHTCGPNCTLVNIGPWPHGTVHGTNMVT